MFHTGYCDYNRFNPDCDIINRPEGSGDYLFLYFMSPRLSTPWSPISSFGLSELSTWAEVNFLNFYAGVSVYF